MARVEARPTIQLACERALVHGTSLRQVVAMSGSAVRSTIDQGSAAMPLDVTERDTKRGPMVFFQSEFRWDNQDGELVCEGTWTNIVR